jgi:chromosome segregation ATPase
MPSPFVSRRLYDAVLADRERIRGERDQFVKDRDAHRAALETAAQQLAEVDTDDTRRQTVALALGVDADTPWAQLITEARRAHETRMRLIREIDDMQRRLADAEAQAATAGPTIDGAPLHRCQPNSAKVNRLTEQNRKLHEQLAVVQAAHEADTRELHDLRQGATS